MSWLTAQLLASQEGLLYEVSHRQVSVCILHFSPFPVSELIELVS